MERRLRQLSQGVEEWNLLGGDSKGAVVWVWVQYNHNQPFQCFSCLILSRPMNVKWTFLYLFYSIHCSRFLHKSV